MKEEDENLNREIRGIREKEGGRDLNNKVMKARRIGSVWRFWCGRRLVVVCVRVVRAKSGAEAAAVQTLREG